MSDVRGKRAETAWQVRVHMPEGRGWDATGVEWSAGRGPAPRFPWERLRGPRRTAEAEAPVPAVEAPFELTTRREREDRKRAMRVAANRAAIAARWDGRCS